MKEIFEEKRKTEKPIMNLKKLYGIDDKSVKRDCTQCINGFYFGKDFDLMRKRTGEKSPLPWSNVKVLKYYLFIYCKFFCTYYFAEFIICCYFFEQVCLFFLTNHVISQNM